MRTLAAALMGIARHYSQERRALVFDRAPAKGGLRSHAPSPLVCPSRFRGAVRAGRDRAFDRVRVARQRSGRGDRRRIASWRRLQHEDADQDADTEGDTHALRNEDAVRDEDAVRYQDAVSDEDTERIGDGDGYISGRIDRHSDGDRNRSERIDRDCNLHRYGDIADGSHEHTYIDRDRDIGGIVHEHRYVHCN